MTTISTITRTITVKEEFDEVLNQVRDCPNYNGGIYVTEVELYYPEEFSLAMATRETIIWIQKEHIVEVRS